MINFRLVFGRFVFIRFVFIRFVLDRFVLGFRFGFEYEWFLLNGGLLI